MAAPSIATRVLQALARELPTFTALACLALGVRR